MKNRSKLTKRYYSNPAEENKNLLTAKLKESSNMIVEAKGKYTNKSSKKLDDPSTMSKAYWSILKTYQGNENIRNLSPLNVDGKIISNFEKKALLFILCLSQCTPINNSSVLPPLEYKVNERLVSINIKEADICLLLKGLNPEKAHG